MAKSDKKFSPIKFFVTLLLGIIAMLAIAVYLFWYQSAVSSESPYDEIFIEINGFMPQPARDWACGRIAERFPGSLPPYTCDTPK